MFRMNGAREAANRPPVVLDFAKFEADRQRSARASAAGLGPITAVFPVARSAQLGGRHYTVEEMRLADLAELQGFIESQAGDPLDGIGPAWADADPESRPARLAVAWESARSWPPRFGTPEGRRSLGSTAGRDYFLWVMLRHHHPGLGPDEVRAVADAIDPAEWSALERIAYGVSPAHAIVDEVAPDLSPSLGVDWPLAITEVVLEQRMTFEQVAALTVSQWRLLRSRGKSPDAAPEFGVRARRVEQDLAAGRGGG